MGNQYWIKHGDKVTGPFTSSQIRQLAAEGKVRGDHEISLDRERWFLAKNAKSLKIGQGPAESSGSYPPEELNPSPQPHPAETQPHGAQAKTVECPFCAEEILAKARKCKHCGEFLDETLATTHHRSHVDHEPEKMFWEGHPSFLHYVPTFVIATLLIIPTCGLSLLSIVWAILDQRYRAYTVTSWKAMVKWGIISRHTKEVAIRDIRNINLSQGIVARLLGVGAVAIASAGTGDIDVKFGGIKNPTSIRDLVRKIKDDSKGYGRD